MKILVLGGDGFCGWPASLHLSKLGHDVHLVDNLSRRKIDVELEVDSLTPIQPISTRVACWNQLGHGEIRFHYFDVAENYHRLYSLIKELRPETIVHYAEQRAAPYSMKSSWHKRYTVQNNTSTTHNLLAALVEANHPAHVVHLGTMGVYGYGSAGMKIPEGYLPIEVRKDDGGMLKQEILYPANPGSVYHLTKTLDQLIFAYYCKNDGIRITDLHQGIVWGTETEETGLDERLINRFDYDGDYGTVLNRFLMQAAVGYPLTVHGSGGQTRAFIHMRDSVRCVALAVENPPENADRVRILNQMTETKRVSELADLVAELFGADIEYVTNPRKEAAENDLHVKNDGLLQLGLNPTFLGDGLVAEVNAIAKKFVDRCNRDRIPCVSFWNEERRKEVEEGSA